MGKKKVQDENIDINEYNPYEVDKLSKIPSVIKIIFLKYWAAAAAVFFMVVSNFIVDFSTFDEAEVDNYKLDFVVILLIALGLAVLFIAAICPLVKLMNNRRNPTYKYNIFNLGGLWNLLFYLVYMFIVSFIVYMIYAFTFSAGLRLPNLFSEINYGIDPFTYGIFFIIVDGIFVLLKNLILYIYQRVYYQSHIKKGADVLV